MSTISKLQADLESLKLVVLENMTALQAQRDQSITLNSELSQTKAKLAAATEQVEILKRQITPANTLPSSPNTTTQNTLTQSTLTNSLTPNTLTHNGNSRLRVMAQHMADTRESGKCRQCIKWQEEIDILYEQTAQVYKRLGCLSVSTSVCLYVPVWWVSR